MSEHRISELEVAREVLEADVAALRSNLAHVTEQLAAERVRAERAEAQLEAIHDGLAAAALDAEPDGDVVGSLTDEPTTELIASILRPDALLGALGWDGPEAEISQPIPVDLSGVVDRAARSSLIVVADGDQLALRQTLCSVIERAAEPVAVTVAIPEQVAEPLAELRSLLQRATPAIEFADAGAVRARPGAQRLESGELLPWGWPYATTDVDPPSVAYIVPGMPAEGSGGVNSVVQEARGLRRLGAPARVCVPEASLDLAHRLYGDQDRLFVPYRRDADVLGAVGDAAVVVATEHTSVPLLARVTAGNAVIACAYYVQDYEALFAHLGSPRSDRAMLSYAAMPGAALFAKTHFLRNVVMARHRLSVAKVEPSLDRSVFTAPRAPRQGEGVTIAAMLRTRTPRRRPKATLASLAMLEAELGVRARISTFGCEQSELDSFDDRRLRRGTHLGLLRSEEVAELYRRSDIVIDGSAYQGFGRTGLEAMACGAVPVLPSLGGVHEFAVDGHNAVLLDDTSPQAITAGVLSLAADRAGLEQMRAAALETAARFSVDRAARSQLEMFTALVARQANG